MNFTNDSSVTTSACYDSASSLDEIDMLDDVLFSYEELRVSGETLPQEDLTIMLPTNPVFVETPEPQQQQSLFSASFIDVHDSFDGNQSSLSQASSTTHSPMISKSIRTNRSSLRASEHLPNNSSDDDCDFVYFGHKKVRKNTPEYYQCRKKSTQAVIDFRAREKAKQKRREIEINQIEAESKRLKAQVEQLVDVLKSVMIKIGPVMVLPYEVENLLKSIDH